VPKVSLMRSMDLTISANTRWVSSSISPSSTRVDKGTGGLNHPSSSRRRTSASMPLMSQVLMSTLGLEAQQKRFPNGVPQRLLDLHAGERLALHAGVERRRPRPCRRSYAIHRDVGVLAQHVIAAAMFG